MRKSLLAIAILSLVFAISCQEKDKTVDYVVLSGKVINPASDSLALYRNREFLPNVIRLKEDHSFSDTLKVEDGVYALYDGSHALMVLLKSGYNLSVEIDASDMTLSHFTGKGAEENNYLIAKSKLEKELETVLSYTYYCDLEENQFLNMNDSVKQIINKFFDEQKGALEADFAFKEEQTFKYQHLMRLYRYNFFNSYYFEHETHFKVSENYPNPFESIAYDDDRLGEVEIYLDLLDEHIRSFLNTDTVEKGKMLRVITRADTIISNEAIKNAYLKKFSEDFLESTDDLDKTYQLLKTKITCKEGLKSLDKAYQDLKKIEKGQPSPSFNLKDINGNMVSLESLRGKLVYIDVWATWCGPCRGELPYLKALEKEMHNKNIHFVSICVWDKEPKWQKFVKEQELQGIQLFCPRSNSAFVDAYHIKGVPHFILLDQEGKIIDNNAKRPSNGKLKETLKSLLKK